MCQPAEPLAATADGGRRMNDTVFFFSKKMSSQIS
jgi:hypothetical protein